MKKEVEIITLIYKSVDYLNFIHNQFQSDFNKVKGWDVKTRIVLNDATDEVVMALTNDMRFHFYKDDRPNDYYLNRVYRCWNYAAETSQCENICFVNSDMAFSPGWLEALLKSDLDKFIPCSRLVESGKLPSGKHAIVKDFGKHPKEFREKEWLEFAAQQSSPVTMSGGLYMPCVFNRQRFLDAGGYPEGNLYQYGDFGSRKGRVIKSGDAYFFLNVLERNFGMKHITVFDSLVCHFQQGEMDE